jgi:hypothetical protein
MNNCIYRKYHAFCHPGSEKSQNSLLSAGQAAVNMSISSLPEIFLCLILTTMKHGFVPTVSVKLFSACALKLTVKQTCNYCGGKTQACFSVSTVSERVEQAIAEHYVRTPEHQSETEYAMLRHSEGGYEWERKGSGIVYVIEDLLGTSEAVAGDVQHYLEEKHDDFEAAKMGEECSLHLIPVMKNGERWRAKILI